MTCTPMPRCSALAILVSIAVLLLGFVSPAHADPKFPSLTGRIVDEARLLSADDKAQLEATLKELEGKSSDQIVVYTTPSLQGYEIEEFGYRLGRFWKIGQSGINNGIVLIIAPNERKVRSEVGRGLEPIMTDSMSTTIIQNSILPGLRRGDFPGGIKAGVRDIKDVLLGDAEEVAKRARSIKSRPESSNDNFIPMIIFGIIFAIFIYNAVSQARQQQLAASGNPNAVRRRRFGDGRTIIIPGGWGGSGGWSGGGGFGGGGGGFSGGGGGFGGGGSSGSW